MQVPHLNLSQLLSGTVPGDPAARNAGSFMGAMMYQYRSDRLTTAALVVLVSTASAMIPASAVADPTAALKADIGAINTCLERSDHRHRGDCVELVALPCIQASAQNAASSRMMCWRREQAAWDHLLNARYGELIEEAKEQDTDPATPAGTSTYSTLRDAQRAWVAFRDAELDRFEASRANAATAWRDADLERLRLDLTAKRVLDLRFWN